MIQPDSVSLRFIIPDKGTRGRTREASADIVPDQGEFGPEYPLVFTFPQFEAKVLRRMDAETESYVSQLHDLLGQCFQAKAIMYWSDTLAKYPEDERTLETFREAQKDYLEKVAGHTNLGDDLIRQLDSLKRPALLTVPDYMDRRREWNRLLDEGNLRTSNARPTEHQMSEQVFLQQPIP